MISVKIGRYQVEITRSVRRVTVTYGEALQPKILTVVDDDGEAWSFVDNGGELGVRAAGVTVLGGGAQRPAKQA